MSADAALVLRTREGIRSTRFDSAGGGEYVIALPSGSHYRVTGRLQELLECIDGQRTLAEIAEEMGRRWKRPLTPDQVFELVQRYIAPHGLLHDGEGAAPDAGPHRLFGWHRTLFRAGTIDPITRIGQYLFAWPVAAAGLALCALAHWSAYARAGAIGPGLAQALGDGTFLLAYGLVLLSVLVHEFGHASACRRFGESYGEIGFGLYLVFPVLYADVTRIWSLSRWQRVIVDLGGTYFQLFVAAIYAALFVQSGHSVWLVALVQINALMLLNLSPLGKFDGYWLVCDALGVANPWRELKRGTRTGSAGGFAPVSWAVRCGLLAYALAVVGTLAFAAVSLGLQGPEMGARFAQAVAQNLERTRLAWQAADIVGLLAHLVRLIGPAALVLGALLGLQRVLSRSLQRRGSGAVN